MVSQFTSVKTIILQSTEQNRHQQHRCVTYLAPRRFGLILTHILQNLNKNAARHTFLCGAINRRVDKLNEQESTQFFALFQIFNN